jgi:enoyl-CoA hydratase/carnithine racemase
MVAFSLVDIKRNGPVATVEIDRPDVMNALDENLLGEIAAAIENCQEDGNIGAIVLASGVEGAFIAGGDIQNFEEMDGPTWKRNFRTAIQDVETAIEDRPTPVVAAVDGVALGGGTEIAMMCDLVIASERARFGQPEIGLGLIPGAGGTQRLTHLVGYLKAKELVLTGRPVPADEAVEIGLINEVVPVEKFQKRTHDIASELSSGPASAQGYAKEAINSARPSLQTGLRLEMALSALSFETPDKEEGVDAFLNDRDPEFND